MVGNFARNNNAGEEQTIQELTIEKACEEYTNIVQLTLSLINQQLDGSLVKYFEGLEELSEKIAARTNFLQNNPSFLSCLSYSTKHVKTEPLREFDEIKITLKEHARRITEKVEEVEGYHRKLFSLVLKNSRDRKFENELTEILRTGISRDQTIKNETKNLFDPAVQKNTGEGRHEEFKDENFLKTVTHQNTSKAQNEEFEAKNSPKTVMQKNASKAQDEEFEDDLKQILRNGNSRDQNMENKTKNGFHRVVQRNTSTAPDEEFEDNYCNEVIQEDISKNQDDKFEDNFPNKVIQKTTGRAQHEKIEDNSLNKVIQKNSRKEQDEEFQDCLDKVFKNDTGQKEDLEIKRSFHQVTIQKSAYSDNSVDSMDTVSELPPLKFQIFSDLPAEVQRRRPFEDLHGRLLQQLEASDSLEGFMKLMERKPSSRRRMKIKNNDDIERKYTGSLWFFPQKGVKRKISKNALASRSSNVSQRCSKIPKTFKHESVSACTCNLLVSSTRTCSSNQDRTRKIRDSLGRAKLKCYDLLDDIHGKDLKPIKSEYPRRDNLYQERMAKEIKLNEAKSYLHRMMDENDKVWRKLLKPVSVKHHQKKHKTKSVKTLMEYLTAPEQKFLDHRPHSLIVMPVKIFYDNYPTKEITPQPANIASVPAFVTDLTKPVDSSPKKLSFSPQNSPKKTETKPVTSFHFSPRPQAEHSPRKPETKPATPPNNPMQRKKEMLEHLRGLKARNDNIQKNIQKAIDVIETKMIDLLSSPSDSNSTEAFNAMELEITNVLKMMSDSEKKDAIAEEVEPEKDENHNKTRPPTSPKVNRGKNILRKSAAIADFTPGVDLVEAHNRRAKSEEYDKVPCKSKKTSKEEGDKVSHKHKKKDDAVAWEKPKPKVEKKNPDEVRKAANIAEGERLLGQVDSVIKKIDSIYTKFYDDGKQKVATAKENTFNNVIEFFDGLKHIIEAPPIEITYKSFDTIEERFQEAQSYCQASVYYEVRLEYPLKCDQGDYKLNNDAEVEEEAVLEESPSKEIWWAASDEGWSTTEATHESTLKTFYTIFFSSLFVALNFDYAS